MASHAGITWAQRSDSLYVTINVSDVDPKTAKVELKADRLSFQGTANGKEYTTELEFFAEVDPEDKGSKYDIKPRNIHFHIVKKDKDAEYWPRLLKDKAKEKNQVAIDWTRYVDEDEEKGGFDTSAMGAGMNFGGEDEMGGMPGMMGGMPGMGMPGAGGGGMDFSSMMGGMGGLGGGAGGAGGMDMAALLKQLQAGGAGAGGFPGMGAEGEGEDEDDDLPDLDEAPEGQEGHEHVHDEHCSHDAPAAAEGEGKASE